jgi:anti-anti-sigma factor
VSGISPDEVRDPRWGPGRFGWSQRCVEGTVVIHLVGELDLSTAAALRSRLMSVAESGGTAAIVLDLSEVCFIDAGSIGLIATAWAVAKSRGRQLWVDGLHGIQAQIFGLLGLESMLLRRTSQDGAGGDAGGRYEPAGAGRRRWVG